MLTAAERALFAIAVLLSLCFTYAAFRRMVRVVLRGQGRLDFGGLPRRLLTGLVSLVSQGRIMRDRPVASLFHWFIAWGFLFYLSLNVTDILEGYISGFRFLGRSVWGGIYRLPADILSIAVIVGMIFLLIRRFLVKAPELSWRDNVKLHPGVRSGVSKDSLIVGAFILAHVGFRFLGASLWIAMEGGDSWQPFANQVSRLWSGLPGSTIEIAGHISWWLALGPILAFAPYFPHSKHAHLFMAPLNIMIRPERKALGALDTIDFEDESIEQFGAARLTDLSRGQIMDAFACVMCNRCQDVCPAYITGKELSPAALEINKRYHLGENMKQLADGADDNAMLLEYAISESALWACTTCGACVEVCPVGAEPMFDILHIRQNQALMDGVFPNELKGAFAGIERNANPWQMTGERLGWAKSLDFPVPTVDENPDFEVLYWVGCAGAFDPTAQATARAIATILHAAGVDFAVLGDREACTGDLARRAGNEYLFYEMARTNIETLNSVGADRKKIVTGCPHCLHTLGAEYPALGGNYTLLHHTQLIEELVADGRLRLNSASAERVTFHDPCYLGRHNGEYRAPREALAFAGETVLEMPRHGSNAFCCGAGGAQVWKEEEDGAQSVGANRFAEAAATGAETLAVGCPFCARMLGDANSQAGDVMNVKDVAEIVAEAISTPADPQ